MIQLFFLSPTNHWICSTLRTFYCPGLNPPTFWGVLRYLLSCRSMFLSHKLQGMVFEGGVSVLWNKRTNAEHLARHPAHNRLFTRKQDLSSVIGKPLSQAASKSALPVAWWNCLTGAYWLAQVLKAPTQQEIELNSRLPVPHLLPFPLPTKQTLVVPQCPRRAGLMEGSESQPLTAYLHKLSLLEQYPSQSDPRVFQTPHYCGLVRIILCWGSCPGHCRIFGGVLASAQQIQVEVPPPLTKQWKSKMFPDIAKCANGKRDMWHWDMEKPGLSGGGHMTHPRHWWVHTCGCHPGRVSQDFFFF